MIIKKYLENKIIIIVMVILFFCLSMITILAPLAIAEDAVYYLSPTGSDTEGDGSYDNPWFSPDKARKSQSSISNGDTVIFLNGNYDYSNTNIQLGPGDGGANNAAITYQAQAAGAVILDFGCQQFAWSIQDTGGYIVLDGLTFIDFKWGLKNYDNHITIKNCNFTATNSWPPSGNACSGADGGGCIVGIRGDYLLVENVIADTCTDPTTSSNHGIYIDSGSYGIIRDSVFRNNRGAGINFQAKGLTYGDFREWDLYGNKIYNNGTTTNKHGVYFRGYNTGGGCAQFDGIRFYNNLVAYNSQIGWGVVTVSNHGCEVEVWAWNNTIYDNAYGVSFSQSTGGAFINNLVTDNNGYDISQGTKNNINIDYGNNYENSNYSDHYVATTVTSPDFLKLVNDATNQANVIDKGADLSGYFTDDHYSNIRDDDGFDIGAHEYNTPDPPKNLKIAQ